MGRLGDHARAAELMRESLVSFKERGILSQIPACLGSLAQIHAARGKPEAAARLLAAARLQGEALGRPLIPLDLQDWTSALEAIRANLDGPTFEQAVEEGQRLTLDEATTLALMD